MFPFTGHLPLVILLLAVLVIFGPKRLPELGSAVGKALREFREATSELRDQVNEAAAPPADVGARSGPPVAAPAPAGQAGQAADAAGEQPDPPETRA